MCLEVNEDTVYYYNYVMVDGHIESFVNITKTICMTIYYDQGFILVVRLVIIKV